MKNTILYKSNDIFGVIKLLLHCKYPINTLLMTNGITIGKLIFVNDIAKSNILLSLLKNNFTIYREPSIPKVTKTNITINIIFIKFIVNSFSPSIFLSLLISLFIGIYEVSNAVQIPENRIIGIERATIYTSLILVAPYIDAITISLTKEITLIMELIVANILLFSYFLISLYSPPNLLKI